MQRLSTLRLGLPLSLAALITTLATLGAVAASSPKPWTSDDILAMRVVTDPQISPDGHWVAYVVSALTDDRSDYQTDIWLAAVAGGAARRLTTSPVADEFPRWSPDGSTLAFLSDRPRPGGPAGDAARDDEGRRQIWMIHPDGGEAWVASSARGGVSSFQWSRDGRQIVFLSRQPKSNERRKQEKDRDDAWTPSEKYAWNRLWVMSADGRNPIQLTSGNLHVTDYSLSPDGKRIAVAAQPTPLLPDQYQSDLFTVASSGGALQPLVQRKGVEASPQWSPDGKWIAFVSQDGRGTDWYLNNYVCVVPAGGGAPRNLTRDFDERVEGLAGMTLAWTPDSKGLVFQASQRTAQHLFRADLDGRVSALTSGPEMNGSASVDGAGNWLAFVREDSEHPREVWVESLVGAGTPHAITDTNPETREHPSYAKQLVHWKGADGMDIEGLLVLPANYRKGTRVPLLLNVHGGPAGTHSNTCTVASKLYPWPLFAQKGWAILMPNPRGSGGYGEAFRKSNVRDWGGKDYEDLMDGVDAMIAQGIADPNRLAVCGWSYGGYMTSTIVTKTDRFKAAVVGGGVINLTSMVGTCDIPDFNRSYFDAWPWEDPQTYVDHSALFHAGNVKTPTSMVHGEADERVPTSQGWEFYTALRKVGVPTDLLLLPRQPHGPREPRLLKSVQQWHLDWLDKYTLDQPQKVRMNGKPEKTSSVASGTQEP